MNAGRLRRTMDETSVRKGRRSGRVSMYPEALLQAMNKSGAKGDVLDVWSSVNRPSLRAAALDLVHTRALQPTPGAEKRNG